ncbi:hypothetical protein [Rathayibacter tanaceti]|uniref:Uncharacterized protein n=1 Tax=Rathayibacter tanaceti TaxID=1671680 RepID=A0AAE6RLI6_9MICO|nr:hypothetical protein [Rathayibacter tanaceti]QHC55815.1 hypothetical protein GSU10_09355 [Rathayibacter tanaceti]
MPDSLSIALTAAFALSVAGFVTVVASAVVSLRRARRQDPTTRVRSTTALAGA